MSEIKKELISKGLEKLKKYLKFDDDYKFRLIIAGLVNNKFTDQSKPIFFLRGGFDSGKTTRGVFMSALMNYNKEKPFKSGDLMNLPMMTPSSPDDYFTVADKVKAALYDNIDDTDNKLYTTICILATGGQLPKRKLFTDADLYKIGKPITVIYTGINIVMNRQDILSRHIIIDVPKFSNDKIDEDILREEFVKDIEPIDSAINLLYDTVKEMLPLSRDIPIPDRFRLRLYARLGLIINNYMDWPDFLADYDKVIYISKEIEKGSDIVEYILNFVKKHIAGGSSYVKNTGEFFVELRTENPAAMMACENQYSLGKYLQKNKKTFEEHGITVAYKRSAEGPKWYFMNKFGSRVGNVNFEEEEEESPELENSQMLK